MRDLSRRADVSWGTLRYHVRRLSGSGMIRTEKRGRLCLLFPIRPSPVPFGHEAIDQVCQQTGLGRDAFVAAVRAAIHSG